MLIEPKNHMGSGAWNLERSNEYRTYLNIPGEHVFELTGYTRNTQNSRDDDGFEFVEKSSSREVLTRYEAWRRMSVRPLHGTDHGFKKYSFSGNFLKEGTIA